MGKTTRPFRYDLNQIPYDYIVEVMNRFEVLDLVDRMHEELWMEVHKLYRRHLKKKKCKKVNRLFEEVYK